MRELWQAASRVPIESLASPRKRAGFHSLSVLIDTSIWLRYLSGWKSYVSTADSLLAAEQVLGHDLVYAELLMGDVGGRLALLKTLGASIKPESFRLKR